LAKNLPEFDRSNVEYMFKLGFHSAENIINADAIELTGIPEVDIEFAEKVQDLCEDLMEARARGKLWPEAGREATMAKLQGAKRSESEEDGSGAHP
jgi:hypothetical protein